MARIQPLDAPYEEAIQHRFDALMPKGMPPLRLFRTVAHNPRALRSMHRGGLLDPGSISLRQRELAILRTCALCDAEYEWGVHATLFGAAAKLGETDLAATTQMAVDPMRWSEDEQLVFELCDALHVESCVSDDLYARLRTEFDEAQILELTTLAGLYHAVSFIVNATQVEQEEWAARWPVTQGSATAG